MGATGRRRLLIGWTLLVAAYFLWETARYRGLFENGAEWQIEHFGFYKPTLTLGVFALILALPVAAIVLLIRRRRPEEILRTENQPLPRARRMRRGLHWFAGALFAGAVLSLLLILLLPRNAGPPQRLDAASPAEPAGVGAAVLTVVTRDARVAIHRQGLLWKRRYTRYVAVPTHVGDTMQVRYFIELADDEPAWPTIEHPWRPERAGTLVRNGLPGTITQEFRRRGYPITAPYYVLFAYDNTIRLPYYYAAIQFAIAGLFVLLVALYQRRHIERLEKHEAEMAALARG